MLTNFHKVTEFDEITNTNYEMCAIGSVVILVL